MSQGHSKTTVWEDLLWDRQRAEVLAGVQVPACFWEVMWEAAAKTTGG